MTKFKRIRNIVLAVLIIGVSILMMIFPQIGLGTILLFMGFYMGVRGLGQLSYYFMMGTHMVGGRIILYKSLIMLDISALAFSATSLPSQYITAYLVAYYGFFGAVDMLRALESKKLKAGSWKLKFFSGLCCLAIAVVAVVYIKSLAISMFILCAGFIYSAIIRIITACRKSAIVYIQ